MSVFLFKDIAKKANDLLSNKKKYTTGGAKKFSVKTKSANGITYNAEATLSGQSVAGKIGAQLNCENGFNIKKFELSNEGSFASDITLDDALDNVQFTLNVKLEPLNSSNPKEESKIGFVYTNDALKADLVVSPMEPTAADASVCYRRDEWFVGGAVGVELKENKKDNDDECDSSSSFDWSGYNCGFGYTTNTSTAALTVSKKNTANSSASYQFSFFNQRSDSIAFAATLGGKIASLQSSPRAALEFGGSYKVDSDTTAYAKLSVPVPDKENPNPNTVSFNLDQQLNSATKLGLTSVLPLDLSGAPQFGVNLAFGI